MRLARNKKLPVLYSVSQDLLRRADSEVIMECVRCRGVMLKERLYDLIENDG
jgi:hypothetical protein